VKYFKGFSTMFASEFKGYNAQKLGKDVLAGVTVAAVALPLALAFGVSSGASAAAGLVTAIVAGIVIGALSGASYQISGPTGAMTAILVSLVARYGMQGVFIACALSGVLLILAGVLKLGDLVSFIPLPVITGFTSGIAVIIALGQVNNLTGLTSQGTESLERIASYFTIAQSLNPYALIIGLAVILFMAFYPKKWSAVVPGSLAAIILATAANAIFAFPVANVGEIPKTLLLGERLDLSGFQIGSLSELVMPAVSIAALGMIESLLCGASAGRMKGEKLNAGTELIAQGIGNLLLPFFGGVPATAAIARTSVAVKAGGQTRLVSVIHSVVLLLSMFALGGIMSKIPLCALAGVLMVTAWRMNEWHVIKDIFRKRIASAMMQFGITMACTVVFDLTIAIVIGVLFSVLTFVVKVSQVKITVSGIIPEKLLDCAPVEGHENTAVVYVSGPLYFGSVRRLEDCVREKLQGKRCVIFSMRGVSLADISAVQAVTDLCNSMTENGAQVYFTSLQPNVEQMFEKCGLKHAVGADRFYWSVDQAIKGMAVAPEF
jgi:SulP family sulfate permease